MDPSTRSIQQVVGDNVRRLREERGVSQDDVARAARGLGARWRQSTVGDVEQCRRVPTVETLLVLAAAFTALEDRTGPPVSPADLLDADGAIEVTPGAWIPAEAVRKMLAGAPGMLLYGTADPELSYRDSIDRFIRQAPMTGPAEQEAQERYALADERAAQRLGIDDGEARGLMARLWGETLSSRSARLAQEVAGGKPSAQRKGIVTRRLTEELEHGLALVRALEAAGERGRLEDELEPEQWATLARELARLRALQDGRAIYDQLGIEGELGRELRGVDEIPWVTSELMARLVKEAGRGDDQ